VFRQVEKAGANFSMELNRLTVQAILVRAGLPSRQTRANGEVEH
jgi:hypothetical protein